MSAEDSGRPISRMASHIDLNAFPVLSAQVSSVPMFSFRRRVWSSKPFVAISFAACKAPASSPERCSCATYAICSAVTLRNWRAIAISPDVGSVVSFPKASATLSTSTPEADAKRATLWLMASNCSPPRTPAFTRAASDSLAWLNVSPAACPALERVSIRSAVSPD
ncbi:hypothetical protein BvCmsHHP012_04967 [Escherichia coli]|nr:hypothetical protein BvCmsHHP012_04967 [Escherichia coli]